MKSNSVMTFIMLAIFVTLVATASRYPENARFMPFVVGIPAILLCLVQLQLDARNRRTTTQADGRSDFEKAEEQVSRISGRAVEFEVAHQPPPVVEVEATGGLVRRELVLWGYFLAFIAGILLFGFWVAIPVFLVTFLRYQAGSSWRTSLILGITAAVALFFVFEKVLRVSPHPGFIADYVFDRA